MIPTSTASKNPSYSTYDTTHYPKGMTHFLDDATANSWSTNANDDPIPIQSGSLHSWAMPKEIEAGTAPTIPMPT